MLGLEYRASRRGHPLYEEAPKGETIGGTCGASVVAGTDGVTASPCVTASSAGVHPHLVSQESLGSGHQLHWRHGSREYYDTSSWSRSRTSDLGP